ncbi:NYN domain-containing protein [Halovivax limisalsi]|uniref:NYN domain-containing protein n=1 Tax=Halovivax limisalsi TaxID=1453760 RepID=UPI001FFCE23C|nr:NYN domain-containing protein [Halovivax limisalsi]
MRNPLRGLFGRDAADGVGLFVDGPNVFRDEFDVDLDDVRDIGADIGRIATARLYVDEHAPPGFVRAGEARGFEVVVTSGDVDVKLAVDATAFVADGRLSTLAVVSRDTDFKPVLEHANARGVETVAIAPGEYGRSDALANAANRATTLDPDS